MFEVGERSRLFFTPPSAARKLATEIFFYRSKNLDLGVWLGILQREVKKEIDGTVRSS